MTLIRGDPQKPLIALAVFFGALALYLFTLAPSITHRHFGSDSAELTATAYTLGVAHPTGYPTYLLLAKAFSLVIPWGDVAYSINMLSAISGALTVALVYLICGLLIERAFNNARATRYRASAAAIIAAASFAFSPILWSQSVMAEVYSLNAIFTAGILFLAMHWSKNPGASAWPLFAAFLLLGLGLGNHVTLAFVGLPLAFVMVVHRRELTRWTMAKFLGAFILGLSVYIYLPLRASANPAINWGDAASLNGFLWTVSAVPYRGLAFGFPWSDLPGRLVEWSDVLVRQFNVPGLLLGILGVWQLRVNRYPLLIFSALLFLPSMVFSVMYDSSSATVYLIPAFMMLALWIGVGFYWLVDITDNSAHPRSKHSVTLFPALFSVVLLAVPGLSLLLNYGDLSLRNDNESLVHARDIFQDMESNSVILADSDQELFPLWYYSLVEEGGRGPTVISTRLTQFDWYLRGQHERYPEVVPAEIPGTYDDRLIQIVEFNLETRPVYITSEADFLLTYFYGSAEGDLYRLLSRKVSQ